MTITNNALFSDFESLNLEEEYCLLNKQIKELDVVITYLRNRLSDLSNEVYFGSLGDFLRKEYEILAKQRSVLVDVLIMIGEIKRFRKESVEEYLIDEASKQLHKLGFVVGSYDFLKAVSDFDCNKWANGDDGECDTPGYDIALYGDDIYKLTVHWDF